jgi:ketosteroid isomerase-like protein
VNLTEAVNGHADLFNEAVRAGDYTAFVDTFAEDAVMRFEAVPVGPFHGRAEIAEAYRQQPPTDTLSVLSIEERDPDTAHVKVLYDSGNTGWMLVRWRDDQVADLAIGFD